MDTVILCFNWGSICHVLPFGNLHILNQPSAQRIFQIWHQQQNKEDKCSQGLKRTHCWWRKSLTVLLFILNELWMEMSDAWMLNRRKKNRKRKTLISNGRVLCWSLKWSGSEVLLDVERNLNQSAEKQRRRCFCLYPYSSDRLRCFMNLDGKSQVIRSLHSNYDTLRQKVIMEQVDVSPILRSFNWATTIKPNQTTKRRIKVNVKPSDGA